MKDFQFKLVVFVLLGICLIASYYIAANTIFSSKILGVVDLNGKYYTLLPKEELKLLVNNQLSSKLPQYIQVRIDDSLHTIYTGELSPTVNTEPVLEYAKGADPLKVFGESFSMLQGDTITIEELEIEISVAPLLQKFPYKIDANNFAFYDGTNIENCSSRAFNIVPDITNLNKLASDALKLNKALLLKSSDYTTDAEQKELIEACSLYLNTTKELSNILGGDLIQDNEWDKILKLEKLADKLNISLRDKAKESLIYSKLKGVAVQTHIPTQEPIYIIKEKTAYNIKKGIPGRDLNIPNTIAALEDWLDSPNIKNSILNFDQTPIMQILSSDTKIIDLSYKISEGKSRLDLIRNNQPNYRLGFAENALKAIDDFVLQPGQEFSFFTDTGIKDRKIRVGVGVCNASTTIFRTALFAGLPITERAPHTSYIESYEYPFYPINNVEATFFVSPLVDLRFRNDFAYPIVFNTIIDKSANDGWQYHTVEAYTSPQVEKTTVQLVNFNKTNIKSSRLFSSSFTREIIKEGNLIQSDTFTSRYYN